MKDKLNVTSGLCLALLIILAASCQAALINGRPCTSESQCDSHKCLNGFCCGAGQCGYFYECYAQGAVRDYNNIVCQSEGVWKLINGRPCSSASECASGKCLNGFCCGAGQCGYFYECYAQGAVRDYNNIVCQSEGVWKLINGRPCTSNDQCNSGNCNNGFCCGAGQCGYAYTCYAQGAVQSYTHLSCQFGFWSGYAELRASLQNASGVTKTEFKECCHKTYEPVYFKVCLYTETPPTTQPRRIDPKVYVVSGSYTSGPIPADVTEAVEDIAAIPMCPSSESVKIWDQPKEGSYTVILDIDGDMIVDSFEVVGSFQVSYCPCATTTTTTTTTTTSTTTTCPTTTSTCPTTTTTCPTTTSTCPTTTTTCPSTTSSTSTTTSTTTTNKPCGNMKLFKFNDHNADGLWETGEAGVGGVMFDVIGGPLNFTAATDQYGEAFLYCIPLGTYLVKERVPEGWEATTNNPRTVNLMSELLVEAKFGNRQVPSTTTSIPASTTTSAPPVTTTAPVCGNMKLFKFNDHNADGLWETGEAPVAGVGFDVIGGPLNFSAVSDQYGEAFLSCIPLGTYLVKERVPDGWVSTTNNPRTVNLLSAELVEARFGNKQLPSTTSTTTTSTSSTTSSTIKGVIIHAKGKAAAGVLPRMQLWIDGILKAQWDVLEVARDYVYETGLTGKGHDIDVVYTNDCWTPTVDRDLYVYYIEVDGMRMDSTDSGVKYDKGVGDAAFDGIDVIAGQVEMDWSGALRFKVDGGYVPTSSTTTSTTTTTTTTTTTIACAIKGDYPPCGEITLSEVVAYINKWSVGEADLKDLVALINAYQGSQ